MTEQTELYLERVMYQDSTAAILGAVLGHSLLFPCLFVIALGVPLGIV